MTESEARQCVSELGWSYLVRPRKRRDYIYAARRIRGQRVERYLFAKAKLPSKTRDDIVKLLSVD